MNYKMEEDYYPEPDEDGKAMGYADIVYSDDMSQIVGQFRPKTRKSWFARTVIPGNKEKSDFPKPKYEFATITESEWDLMLKDRKPQTWKNMISFHRCCMCEKSIHDKDIYANEKENHWIYEDKSYCDKCQAKYRDDSILLNSDEVGEHSCWICNLGRNSTSNMNTFEFTINE